MSPPPRTKRAARPISRSSRSVAPSPTIQVEAAGSPSSRTASGEAWLPEGVTIPLTPGNMALVTLVMSVGFAKAEKFNKFEYPVLIVLATLGMLMMVSANDLMWEFFQKHPMK